MEFISDSAFSCGVKYFDLKDRIWEGLTIDNCWEKLVISGSIRDFMDLFKYLKDSNIWLDIHKKLSDFFIRLWKGKEISLPFFEKEKYGTRMYNNQRVQFKIVCSRAISHQFIRHRMLSYLQRSMRYIDESKDYEFVLYKEERNKLFLGGKRTSEETLAGTINALIGNYETIKYIVREKGIARKWLPIGTRTKFIVTGRVKDFENFIETRLQTKSKSQGEMRFVAEEIEKYLDEIKKGW